VSGSSRIEQLHAAVAEQRERDADPWLRILGPALPRNMTTVSTNVLCQLLGILPTTGNARRVARSMRALGFAPIKSHKLQPGGWRHSECRGWVRLSADRSSAQSSARSAASRSIQDSPLPDASANPACSRSDDFGGW
jgi:hypothetical protein